MRIRKNYLTPYISDYSTTRESLLQYFCLLIMPRFFTRGKILFRISLTNSMFFRYSSENKSCVGSDNTFINVQVWKGGTVLWGSVWILKIVEF